RTAWDDRHFYAFACHVPFLVVVCRSPGQSQAPVCKKNISARLDAQVALCRNSGHSTLSVRRSREGRTPKGASECLCLICQAFELTAQRSRNTLPPEGKRETYLRARPGSAGDSR